MATTPNSGVQLNLMDSQPNQNQNNEPMNKTIRNLNKTKRKLKLIIIILTVIVLILILLASIFAIQYYQAKPPVKSCNQSVQSPLMKKKSKEQIYKINPIWSDYKLPNFIIPTHYTILFQMLTHKINRTIDPLYTNDSDLFYGNVSLKFHLTKPNKFFILHYENLDILSYKLYSHEKNPSKLKDISGKINRTIYDKLFNYWIFVLNDELAVNTNYTINIVYRGFILLEESAVLKSFYEDIKRNKTKIIIYSKLEPAKARNMMPCFDDPTKKVYFKFNIIHENSKTALTNMPKLSSKFISTSDLIDADDYEISKYGKLNLTKFQVTPILMSSYLISFNILEDYTHLSQERKPGHLVRIWYPDIMKDVAEKPLDFAVKCENQMERHFKLMSPLPKTDHVYIPNFASGAMENWGLITYRDHQLLVKNDTSIMGQVSMLKTIAHELAHYWFGNYVTLNWWNDLWVNEGFATYYSSLFYMNLMNFSGDSRLLAETFKSRLVIYRDVSKSAPIIKDVKYPKQFPSTFDKFTYSKGSCLIRWLSSIMGSEKYDTAIREYLQMYKTNNSRVEQFFDIIDQQPKIITSRNVVIPSLKNMFMIYLNTSRFPLLSVSYDQNNKKISITQESVNPNKSDSTKWPIHITYVTHKNKNHSTLYFEDKIEFPVDLSDTAEFIVINSNTKAYVEVKYSDFLFDRLMDAFKRGRLNNVSRYVIFENYAFLTRSMKINVTQFKRIIDTLSYEINPFIWMKFYKTIYLQFIFSCQNKVKFTKFRNYIIKLSKKAWDNFYNNKYTDKLEKEYSKYILRLSAEMENKEAIDWISKKYNEWLEKPYDTKLPNHLERIILFYGSRLDDRYENWLKIWKLLHTNDKRKLNTDTTTLKIALLGTSKPYLLHKVFDLFTKKYSHISHINKASEFYSVISYITLSPNSLNTFKNWLLKNADEIVNYFLEYGYNPNMKLKHIQHFVCSFINDIRWVRPFEKYIDMSICYRVFRKNLNYKRKMIFTFLDMV